jgi:hypothetical protein
MSYPLVRLGRDYALVAVRKGRGAQSWGKMQEIFNGAASNGQEWKAGEGAALAVRHCQWPSDPDSGWSVTRKVSSIEGLETGQAELLVID